VGRSGSRPQKAGGPTALPRPSQQLGDLTRFRVIAAMARISCPRPSQQLGDSSIPLLYSTTRSILFYRECVLSFGVFGAIKPFLFSLLPPFFCCLPLKSVRFCTLACQKAAVFLLLFCTCLGIQNTCVLLTRWAKRKALCSPRRKNSPNSSVSRITTSLKGKDGGHHGKRPLSRTS